MPACHAGDHGFKSRTSRSPSGNSLYYLIMKELLSELNVNVSSLVRSGVVLLLGAPVVLATGGLLAEATRQAKADSQEDARQVVIDYYQGAAAEACVKFLVSKSDSKMERDAKTALDEVFEGDVNHAEVCKWVFS